MSVDTLHPISRPTPSFRKAVSDSSTPAASAVGTVALGGASTTYTNHYVYDIETRSWEEVSGPDPDRTYIEAELAFELTDFGWDIAEFNSWRDISHYVYDTFDVIPDGFGRVEAQALRSEVDAVLHGRFSPLDRFDLRGTTESADGWHSDGEGALVGTVTVSYEPDRFAWGSPGVRLHFGTFSVEWGLTQSVSAPDDVWGSALDPDAEYIFAATRGAGTRVHAFDDGAHITTLGSGDHTGVDVSPDGSLVAYAASGTTGVAVRSVGDWSLEEVISPSGIDHARTPVFSPSGEYLAFGSQNDVFYVYETATWDKVESIKHSNSNIYPVAWSRDEQYVAFGGAAGDAYVHEVGQTDGSGWDHVTTITATGRTLWGIAFTDDFLAFGGDGEDVYVHEIGDSAGSGWDHVTTLNETTDDIRGLEASPDDRFLVYGTDSPTGEFYVHDIGLADGTGWGLVAELDDPNDRAGVAGAIDFSADSAWMSAAAFDPATWIYQTPDFGEVKFGSVQATATGTATTTPRKIATASTGGSAAGTSSATPTRVKSSGSIVVGQGTASMTPHRGVFSGATATATGTTTATGSVVSVVKFRGSAEGTATMAPHAIHVSGATGDGAGTADATPERARPSSATHTATSSATMTMHRGRYGTNISEIVGVGYGEGSVGDGSYGSGLDYQGSVATSSATMSPSVARGGHLFADGVGTATMAPHSIRVAGVVGTSHGFAAVIGTVVEQVPDPRHYGFGVSPAGVTPNGVGRVRATDAGESRYVIFLRRPDKIDSPLDAGREQRVITDRDLDTVTVRRRHTSLGDYTISLPGHQDLPDWNGADTLIYHDGELLFRGRMDTVDHSSKSNYTRAEGYGIGIHLNDGQAFVPLQNIPVPEAIEHYWDEYTEFDATVHWPETSPVFIDKTIVDAHDHDSLVESFADRSDGGSRVDIDTGVNVTDPFDIAEGELRLLQSCFTMEATDYSEVGTTATEGFEPETGIGSGGTSIVTNELYSGGEGVRLTAVGDYVEYEFSPNYQIPQTRIGVKIAGQDKPEVKCYVDGEEVETVFEAMGERFPNPEWIDFSEFGDSMSNLGGTRGETHTIRFEVTQEDPVYDGGFADIDVVAPYDGRYEYTFPLRVDDDTGFLDGPELYPDHVQISPGTLDVDGNVTDASLDVEMNDISGLQELALSNTDGDSFESHPNTETLDVDFELEGTYGYSVTPRFTLSRFGERDDATPMQGIEPQSLSAWKLVATANDLPVVGEEEFTDTHFHNLQELHDKGGMLFTLDYREQEFIAESFPPNTLKDDFPLAENEWDDFESTHSNEDYYNRVVVQGRRRENGDRLIVDIQDDDEIRDLGGNPDDPEDPSGIRTYRHLDPRLQTRTDVKSRAEQLLARTIAEREREGKVTAAPRPVKPGVAYFLPPLDRHLVLESVRYTDGRSESVGDYRFEEIPGLAERLAQLRADAQTLKDMI